MAEVVLHSVCRGRSEVRKWVIQSSQDQKHKLQLILGNKFRIDEEHALKEKYGLKKIGGMKEIWRRNPLLDVIEIKQ